MKLIERSESCISNPICTDQCDRENLDNWKLELQAIRESKLKGHMVRARVQWLHLGERPTKFFCSLEQKHYIEKTVRKIQTEDGRIITDQADILKEIEFFYSKLFQSRDTEISDIDLNKLFKNRHINKLTSTDSQGLGKPLTSDELGKTLKDMKNNKTPGIDGFQLNFSKYFGVN